MIKQIFVIVQLRSLFSRELRFVLLISNFHLRPLWKARSPFCPHALACPAPESVFCSSAHFLHGNPVPGEPLKSADGPVDRCALVPASQCFCVPEWHEPPPAPTGFPACTTHQLPPALSSTSPSPPTSRPSTRTYEPRLLAFSSTFCSINMLVSPPLKALKTQIGLPWTLHILSLIVFSFIFVVLGIKLRTDVGHTRQTLHHWPTF